MDMKIVGITVAILVSITVLAGVLMPVLDDATATTDTFTNDGIIYLDKYDAQSETVVLVWDYESPSSISINGEVLVLPDVNYLSIDMGNDWFVRYIKGTGMSFVQPNSTINATIANEDTLTVTLNSGTVTATSGETTKTDTYTECLCITANENSGYVMKEASKPAYMLEDSEFYAYGITSSYAFKITGNIEDGATVSQLRGATVAITDTAITSTEVADYNGLYSLDKITFKYDGTEATYNMFVVPHEVTAERSVHFTDNQNALFAVIPMLVIVAILIGVVALVIRSRID